MNKSRKNIALAIIERALWVFSALTFYNAYQIWSQYQWAMRRLEGSFLLIAGYPNSELTKVFLAIREYATLFPWYFLAGLLSMASGLILIAINSSRRLTLTASILMTSSVFPFLEAYNIWKIYQEATKLPNPSTAYNALVPVFNAYGMLLPLYLLIGSMAITPGLILTAVSLRKYCKAKAEASTLKPTSDNSSKP